MERRTFKVILVGDSGVGKTTFLKRHLTGEFERVHVATQGAEVHKLQLTTSRGKVELQLWDTAGIDKLGGLKEAYFIGADAAIIMFGLDSKPSYRSVARWYKDVAKVCKEIPMILVGNKADVREKLKGRQISFQRARNLQYFDISLKTNYQYEKPFLWILKSILGDKNLRLLENKAIMPTPLNDLNDQPLQIQRLRRELLEAQGAVLPDQEQ